ncbi:MAG: ATP-binding cassette domain-containing protein, partial [Firmicutes bacterium]|nr:ATP-binding cassette domain-containing protein [Bacillota bacterium]
MLKVEALYKNFDDFTALNGLDLNIKKGSIYGLIGVNGSGKTTLIKHITGALVQDEGLVTIEDQDVRDNIEIKLRLGYIADDLYFMPGYNIIS